MKARTKPQFQYQKANATLIKAKDGVDPRTVCANNLILGPNFLIELYERGDLQSELEEN